MALVVESENTLTTVIGSEQSLAAPTTNAIRVIRIDLNALAPGEIAHLRIKTKVRAAGTVRDQHYVSYIGPAGNPINEIPPITADLGATFTLTQVNGSVRSIDWKILTLGSPPSVESENTQTCTVGTPHTLLAPTTNKTRLLRLDLNPLTAGEGLRVQIQNKVRTSGTIRNQYDVTYQGQAGTSILESVPVSADLGSVFVITQLNGTGRLIDWKILTLD
jgi:hypothetical protein